MPSGFSANTVSPAAARWLTLWAQGLEGPCAGGPAAVRGVLDRLGAIQIDSISVAARSHYLTVWSRLGRFDPADLDRLIYRERAGGTDDLAGFEGWQHAACVLRLADYSMSVPHMRFLADNPAPKTREWLEIPGSHAFLRDVIRRIDSGGPLMASQLESGDEPDGSFLRWSVAKTAMEHLFATGEVMVVDRQGFEPVYDLTDRVLPGWVDRRPPEAERLARWRVETAVRLFGICTPGQAADADHRVSRTQANGIVRDLVTDGVLTPVTVDSATGRPVAMVLHRDHRSVMDDAERFEPERTSLIGPFDNLFWPKGRDRLLWGYEHSFEAYKPPNRRRWGYYTLAILHCGELVGRLDPKLDRRSRRLAIERLHTEVGAGAMAGLAAALSDLAGFVGAESVTVGETVNGQTRRELLAALSSWDDPGSKTGVIDPEGPGTQEPDDD